MSTIEQHNVLHLKLDEVAGKKAKDYSSSGHYCNMKGNPEVIPDDTFGGCLNLKGEKDYIEIPFDESLNFDEGSFTIMFWMKSNYQNELDKSYKFLLSSYGMPLGRYDVYQAFIIENKTLNFGVRDKDNHEYNVKATSTLLDDKWHFVTLCRDINKKQIWIMVDDENEAIKSINEIGRISPGRPLIIGARETPSEDNSKSTKPIEYPFKGNLSNIRLYKTALTRDQAVEKMKEDQTAWATFRKSFPIEFWLTNEEGQSTLILDDNDLGKEVTLNIRNASEQEIVLPACKDGDADSYHFKLQFRPNILQENSLKGITIKEKGWYTQTKPEDDGTVSLMLFNEKALNLKASEPLELTLQNLRAVPEGGMRHSRILLVYQQLHFKGNPTNQIDGYRISHFDIINRMGEEQVPLALMVLGSNRVLNSFHTDSESNSSSVRLRLLNTKPKPTKDGVGDIPVNLKDTKNGGQSVLYFTFEGEGDHALADDTDLVKISIKPLIPEDKDNKKSKDDELKKQNTWCTPKVTTQSSKVTVELQLHIDAFKAGQHYDLELSHIKTDKPSGLSTITMHYANLPGYWDGQLSCELEKSVITEAAFSKSKTKNAAIGMMPVEDARLAVGGDILALGNVKVTGNVGIGTTAPQEKLDVNDGNIRLSDGKALNWGSGGKTLIEGSQSGDYMKMTVGNREVLKLGQEYITANKNASFNGTLTVNSHSSLKGNLSVDGNITLGSFVELTNSSAWIGKSETKGVYVGDDGKVGVGTKSPKEMVSLSNREGEQVASQSFSNKTHELHIGVDKDTCFVGAQSNSSLALQSGNRSHTLMLTREGRLGLGTTSPREKFVIEKGNIRLTDDQQLNWGSSGKTWIEGSQSKDYMKFTVGNSELLKLERNGITINQGIALNNGGVNIPLEQSIQWGDKSNNAGLKANRNSGGSNSLHLYVNTNSYVQLERDQIHLNKDVFFQKNIFVKNVIGSNKSQDTYGYNHGSSWYRLSTFGYGSGQGEYSDARWIRMSDQQLKTNIQPMQGALHKLQQLQAVTFDWNQQGLDYYCKDVEDNYRAGTGKKEDDQKVWDAERQRIQKAHNKTQKGFIAQEIEKVFPEWVVTKEDGMKAIDTQELQAVLVAALNELRQEKDSEIAQLQLEIAQLKAQNTKS